MCSRSISWCLGPGNLYKCKKLVLSRDEFYLDRILVRNFMTETVICIGNDLHFSCITSDTGFCVIYYQNHSLGSQIKNLGTAGTHRV